jgi:hypothetical protein
MRREELLRLLRTQPFRPFRLRLSNDSTYEIHHPDMAIVTPSAVYVGVPSPNSTTPAADDIVIVSLLHVLAMEYLAPAVPSASN